MKKKHVIAIVVTILLLSCYAPIPLRIAVFFYSPGSAFNKMTYEKLVDHPDRTWYRELYWIKDKTPIDYWTKDPLCTWVVYKIGPFHLFSTYYGEA